MNGKVVLNLADWIERRKDAVNYADHIIASVRIYESEIRRLRGIIDKMDQHSPRADRTCAEPGITLSEAVMRAWPELAEPKDEVSA